MQVSLGDAPHVVVAGVVYVILGKEILRIDESSGKAYVLSKVSGDKYKWRRVLEPDDDAGSPFDPED